MNWETSIYINDSNHIKTMNEWIDESMSQHTTRPRQNVQTFKYIGYCSQDCNANWIEFTIGQHGQFRVINKAMKMTATNMTYSISLDYTEGHTQ